MVDRFVEQEKGTSLGYEESKLQTRPLSIREFTRRP